MLRPLLPSAVLSACSPVEILLRAIWTFEPFFGNHFAGIGDIGFGAADINHVVLLILIFRTGKFPPLQVI